MAEYSDHNWGIIMPEARDCRVTTNLEPTYQLLIERVSAENGQSISLYLRSLVMADLASRGLLTQEVLLRVTTTDSVEQLEKMVEARVAASVAASYK